MKIYDSLTGEKKSLVDIAPNKKIRLFVCGPTVYDYPHIGNFRTYVAFDIIAKYLKLRGYSVNYLQNITDIDDKIIKRAEEQKIKPKELVLHFEKIYHTTEKELGVSAVQKYARATSYIKQIIAQIQTLETKGHAYLIKGDGYYFDITTDSDYGKLAKRTVEQAEDGISRIDEGVDKRNKGDFCLWKFWSGDPAEPTWKAPFGKGRPGWHIEDTAITEKEFGPQYELHGGGIDLKFPHHEAEIAQQESASGKKPMVKAWMHAGFLLVNNEKMAKSKNNFITTAAFLARYSPTVFRWLVASHHYRHPLNYTEDLVAAAQRTLDSLAQFIAKLKMASGTEQPRTSLASYEALFHVKMEDDFNTPEAVAVLFNFINDYQKTLWQMTKTDAKASQQWLISKLTLFGITLSMPKIPLKITQLVKRRELSRTNKQFTQADDLRRKIEVLGYTIEDTPKGPFLWPLKNPI